MHSEGKEAGLTAVAHASGARLVVADGVGVCHQAVNGVENTQGIRSEKSHAEAAGCFHQLTLKSCALRARLGESFGGHDCRSDALAPALLDDRQYRWRRRYHQCQIDGLIHSFYRRVGSHVQHLCIRTADRIDLAAEPEGEHIAHSGDAFSQGLLHRAKHRDATRLKEKVQAVRLLRCHGIPLRCPSGLDSGLD